MNKRIELRKRDKATRKLFVVDIENAVGNGVVSEEACQKVKSRIERVYKPEVGDLTVIGVSHSGNVFPAASWDGARVKFRAGHDGADLALEEVLYADNVEKRFGEVVIVSGDGLFAMQAERLRSLGVKVTVDSRASSLSRCLAFRCSAVRLAPDALAA